MRQPMTCAALLAALAATSGCAEYTDRWFAPYIGLDYTNLGNDYASDQGVDYNNIYEDNFAGINPVIGANLGRNLAVEGGYFTTQTGSKNIDGSVPVGFTGETKLKLSGVHADVIGKIPLTDANKVRLLATAGVMRVKGDAKLAIASGGFTSAVKDSDEETVWRAGGGVEAQLTPRTSGRVLVRYVPEMLGVVDSTYQVNAGVQYKF